MYSSHIIITILCNDCLEVEMSVMFIKQLQRFFIHLLRKSKARTMKFSKRNVIEATAPYSSSTARSNSASSFSSTIRQDSNKKEDVIMEADLTNSDRKIPFGKRLTSLRRKGSNQIKSPEERAPLENEREELEFPRTLSREGDENIECANR